MNLTYDGDNHLTGVSGAATAAFVYDGDGNRVKATLNGTTLVYIGDHTEWNDTSGTLTKYYYAGVQRVAMRSGSTLYYLLSDHLGSTTVTADSSGGYYSEMRYTTWGETRFTDGTTPTRRHFTGQLHEDYINLYWYGSRWYDPSLKATTIWEELMESMKKFSYRGFHRIKIAISQFFGVLGLLFFTSFTVFSVVAGLFNLPGSANSIFDDPRVTILCFMTFFLIVTGAVCSTLINYLPTVWLNEKGLIISAYLFFKIRIPWPSIVDIEAGNPPGGYILVRARRITPFHRIYGWLYSRSFYPSFLIGKGITDRDNLVREIKQRIQRSA